MIFPDGFKKLGFFQDNIFKSNLERYDQILEFINRLEIEHVPEQFNQEVKEFLGLNQPIRDSEDEYIDKEIKPLGEGAKDDPPDETAFKNMQEIISTNLGGFNGLTKSAYAAQVEEIDRQIEEERKLQFTTMDYNSKENLNSPTINGPSVDINESKSNFSQNTSIILPEIGRKRGMDFQSPYND